MKSFALVSPLMGRRRDMPSLVIPETFPYECKNVVNDGGLIKHADGRRADWAGQADDAILLLKEFWMMDQTKYLMIASKDAIYYLDAAAGTFTDITPGTAPAGTNADLWSSVSYNDLFLMTRYTDVPYKWTGTGNAAILGGLPPKARFIATHRNYVFLGYLIDTVSGNSYPSTIEWCDLAQPERWISGASNLADSGQATLDGPDPITGFAAMGSDYLGIFKENSLFQLYTVGGSLVHNISRQISGIGCTAPFSIVSAWDGVYFYGTDRKFWKWDGTSIPVPISDYRIEDIAESVNPNALNTVYGCLLEGLYRIGWLIPSGTATSPDKLVIWDMKRQAWSWMEIPGTCLCPGGYRLTADDSWDVAEGTWDEATRKWDDTTYVESAKANLIGSSDGYIYRLFSSEQDLTADFTGTFQSQKLPFGTPHLYKRLTRMQHWFKNEASARSVNIAIKKDDSTDFETAKSLSLNGSGDDMMVIEHSCDYTARTFQLQVSGTQNFQYLGTLFWYKELGTR